MEAYTEVGRLRSPAATKILAILLTIVLVLSMSNVQAIAGEVNNEATTTNEDASSVGGDRFNISGGGAFIAI